MAVSAVAALAFALAVVAQQPEQGVPRSDPRFYALGSAACRPCHLELYDQWTGSTHAVAARKLTTEEKFAGGCVPCHVPDTVAFEDGVGCEACHGQGSAYAELDVMIDPFKSLAAGLQQPQGNCAYCHNPGHDFHVERDLPAEALRIHPRR